MRVGNKIQSQNNFKLQYLSIVQNFEPSSEKLPFSFIFPATSPMPRSIPLSWHLEDMDGDRDSSWRPEVLQIT